MSCGRLPDIWPEALSPLASLPDDPPALRRWLREHAAADGEHATDTTDDMWPDEETPDGR